jgi:predicted anti-sigma-YlaC factor YlaD
MSTVAPTCDLVREALSARLDNEEAQLAQPEIDRHLVGCPRCRLFADGATALRRQTPDLKPLVQPSVELLATVASARCTPSTLSAIRTLVTRVRGVVGSRRVPLALAAMAVSVALPIASTGALSRLDSGPSQSRVTCSLLLFHRPYRP